MAYMHDFFLNQCNKSITTKKKSGNKTFVTNYTHAKIIDHEHECISALESHKQKKRTNLALQHLSQNSCEYVIFSNDGMKPHPMPTCVKAVQCNSNTWTLFIPLLSTAL
jgi:hypothetical protein